MYSLRKLSFAQTNLLDQLFVLKKEQQIKKLVKMLKVLRKHK